MNKTLIIIQREFSTRVKKKSFILLTILMPFIFAALIFVPVWLASIKSDEQKTVMVVDPSQNYLTSFQDTPTYRFVPAAQNEDRFYEEDSNVEAVVVIQSSEDVKPKNVTIYSPSEVPVELLTYIQNILNEKVRNNKLAHYNIPELDRVIEDIQEDVPITTIKRDKTGEETTSNTFAAMIFGMCFTMMIYMFVLSYGAMVMQSVIEEKTNRIVELMVSSVKPFQLMMGKIIGCALVGFTQIFIWAVMLAIILGVCVSIFGMEAQPAPETTMGMMNTMPANMPMNEGQEILQAILNLPFLEMGIMFIIYFIGGYLLYASFYAAVGASVNEQEDSSQFVLPMVFIMIFGLYAAIYGAENPNGPLAFWASIFPLTSPIVMMVRIPFTVPLWQELLSIALLYTTAITSIWVGGKIYRVGILMYGKKPTVKEIIKWLRYK